MSALEHCGKIEIRESPVEGYGVFATGLIKRGEIIERTPFIILPRFMALGKALYDMLCQTQFVNPKEKYIENLRHNLNFKDIEKYLFKWMPPHGLDDGPITWTCLPLGATAIINSSNTNNNCGWKIEPKTFCFIAERDVQAGEELFSHYGYMLSETGQIFISESVFNLGMDKGQDNLYKVRAIRFADANQLEQSKTNPSYAKLAQLISLAKDGLSIIKLSGSSPDGIERAAMDLGEALPMSFIYAKISEFKHSPLPIIKIVFKFAHKDTGQEIVDEVIFRK